MVFLEDYDISLAQQLVQGVDVWVNTPRRPWEACGTSGMKVLVNGGLNLSTLDGWWEEAYAPGLGWAIGDRQFGTETEQDSHDADELYTLVEQQMVPRFYDRDAAGAPRAWLASISHSMTELTLRFGAVRMVRDYLDKAYLPAAQTLRDRVADDAAAAKALASWDRRLRRGLGGVTSARRISPRRMPAGMCPCRSIWVNWPRRISASRSMPRRAGSSFWTATGQSPGPLAAIFTAARSPYTASP